jgi:hypothetical protein
MELSANDVPSNMLKTQHRRRSLTLQIPTFIVAASSRSALVPTHPLIQWASRVILGSQSSRNMKLTTKYYSLLWLRISDILPRLPMNSLLAWCLDSL